MFGSGSSIERLANGAFIYYDSHNNKKENYNQAGQLLKTTYANGDTLTYSYNSNSNLPNQITDQRGQSLYIQHNGSQIQTITLPTGKQLSYGYDSNGNLTQVRRPGYGQKQYVYEYNAGIDDDLMTGIIDEKGNRYATFSYDNQGRGVSTEHAQQTQRYSSSYRKGYGKNSTVSKVVNPYQTTITYGSKNIRGKKILDYYSNGGKKYIGFIYDNIGNITSYTSWDTIRNHRHTNHFTYNNRNLTTSEIIAKGKPESTITLTEWHPTLPVKTKITKGTANIDGTLKQSLRETTYTHDERGNVLTRTITDVQTRESRIWTYTYNDYNQKLSETAPDGLTQYWDYTDAGYLTHYTDSQGLITVYSNHNLDGKPQTITSPTAQVTTISYDDAGRITTQTTDISSPNIASLAQAKSKWIEHKNMWRGWFKMPLLPNPVKYDVNISDQTATTSYEYDGVGQLIKATLPDGEVVTYSYDDAHRLVGVADSLGNKTKYTLNGAGDITQTDSYDPQGVLANSSQRTYNEFGNLNQQLGNNGQAEIYQYDGNGNLLNSNNALRNRNTAKYDTLNRKTEDTDSNNGKTYYEYDGLGNLTKVTDPKGNATTYSINAFGETLEQNSPDTGLTRYAYEQGRLTKVTDSEGREQNYHYDDKGRITDTNNQRIASYHYDNYGRISKLTTANTNISYIYNSNNQIIEKKQTANQQTLITRYAYTNGGKQTQIRLPSGKLIEYHYNKGILQGISVKHDGKTGDTETEIINNLTYSPNGITGYTWGQTNQPVSYDYDLDGRLTNITDNALNRSYTYDVGNRITDIIDNQGKLTFNYQHDKLDRLINQSLHVDNASQALSYGYDRNSNRTQKTVANTVVNTPVLAENNQYQNYQYDQSGKTLNDGVRSYSYNSNGRISSITKNNLTLYNSYNALGQRVIKTIGSNKTYFNYDESGKLIGEYDNNGNAVREYIYLENKPIALISNERNGEILQIHTDHLQTPKVITDNNGTVLWQWETEAFGSSKPKIETIKMPLRMAGQYADDEVELFYNYYRFYDPNMGRYVENDPIGLADGTNSFNYVDNSPLFFTDFKGLAKWKGAYAEGSVDLFPIPQAPIVDVGARGFHFTLQSQCEPGVEKKYIVQVWAVSAGANIDKSILGRVSFGVGTAEFDDNNGTQPNPSAFTGFFGAANISVGFLATITSYVNMGKATGNINGGGLSTDYGAIEAYGGYSKVYNIKEKECGCE